MGRSPCCEKAHINKGAWTKEEDDRLKSYIEGHGEGCWRSLPKSAGLLRCGKSCRLRWINYLRPDLKRGNFTQDEDELIIKLHTLLGNKWSLIAGRLPGRTDNEIKNYWNTHIRRKLLRRGIDPATHRPIHDETVSLNNVKEEATNFDALISSPDHQSKEEKGSTGECCPDLNLELRISPPYQQSTLTGGKSEPVLALGLGLCFSCSLVKGNNGGEDCICENGCSTSNNNSTVYDFLRSQTGVLESKSFDYVSPS